MKNVSLFLSLLCAGVILAACGDNGTKSSESKKTSQTDYEVYQLGDLPQCNSSRKGKTASVGPYGDEYVCDCREWVNIEMQQMFDESLDRARNNHTNDPILDSLLDLTLKNLDNLPCADYYPNQDTPKDGMEDDEYSSSSNADTMTNEKDSLFSSSSSVQSELSDFEKENVVKIENTTLVGVAQKGPYLQGGTYRIIPLDGETLKSVGDTLTDYFKASDGKYSFSNLKMPSQYAMVDVNGYYLNELTGQKSGLQVSIGAIVDAQKSANINIITDLEYERVKYLFIEKEYNIVGAKKRAFSEVLAAFNIDTVTGIASQLDIMKTGDANGVLLALSIIVQNSIGSGIYMMKDFRNDIKEDGEWEDKTTRAKMADLAYESDKAGKLSTYRENVAKWGGTVPNFESYVNEFWSGEYGLEKCSNATVGKIKKNQNALSAYKDDYFVCESGKWRFIDQLEYNTYNRECDVEGTIIPGIIDKEMYYKCEMKYDYAGYKKGLMWREATPLEVDKYYTECVADGKLHLFSDGNTYVCEPDTFRIANRNDSLYYVACYEKLGCTKGKEGKFTDSRDGMEYRTISVGNQVWMAENLNFETEDSYCYNDTLAYCAQYGRLYTWNAALNACPKGWHLPDSTDWRILINAIGGQEVAGKILKSVNDWEKSGKTFNDGVDGVGFSALPVGQRYESGTYSQSRAFADFWTSSEHALSGSIMGVYVGFANYGSWVSLSYDANGKKERGHSVRCIKD